MRNFTVGPVTCKKYILDLGKEQIPYFRTSDFSKLMLENEKLILELANAPQNSKAVFMTNSSTGAMEAVVMNCFSDVDKVLVIDGGTFGHRFVELCRIHNINFDVLCVNPGCTLKKEDLYRYDKKGYTGLLINICETSTGVLYDSEMVGEFCRLNNLFYVCDCVSAFLSNEFDMAKCHSDIMITGSQKTLACPPGISIIVLSSNAVDRVYANKTKSLYFNLKDMLIDMQRGQTPFTPAVSILIQINKRLKEIESFGGSKYEINRVSSLAIDFRNKIKDLPFSIFSNFPANSVTALHPFKDNSYEIFEVLKDEYDIWVCPNGGELKNHIFRVGHIGNLSYEDNDYLIYAFNELLKRRII